MCWWDSEAWVPLLQKVPGTDSQVSQKQLVPGTGKWFPQELEVPLTNKWFPQELEVPLTNKWLPQVQKVLSTEKRQDSKIPLTRLAWDWAGAKLWNILDNRMVYVLI